MQGKYIVFQQTQKGRDGFTYIGGVKYKIKKEMSLYYCLKGIGKPDNLFAKKGIERIASIGQIFNT